ncbi:MAG: hypothetical protein NVS9B12_15690 [Vulcanimicrobiaceae bacterium]
MPESTAQAARLLRTWLQRQLPDAADTWLAERLDAVRSAPSETELDVSFGLAPRKLGKDDLELSAEDRAQAAACRPGWTPGLWSVDQAARVLLLLNSGGDAAAFAQRLERFFSTADVGEQVALYRGLPLFPGQEQYLVRAQTGTRTNMRAVFEAVAHNNPYPAEQFSEPAWNQMVVKALFIGSTLLPIQQLDRRQNGDLARMLVGYAHERWAAGRTVSPELWRCVGQFADTSVVADLQRALSSADAGERRAAALALADSSLPQSQALLATVPELRDAIESGRLTWDTFKGNQV